VEGPLARTARRGRPVEERAGDRTVSSIVKLNNRRVVQSELSNHAPLLGLLAQPLKLAAVLVREGGGAGEAQLDQEVIVIEMLVEAVAVGIEIDLGQGSAIGIFGVADARYLQPYQAAFAYDLAETPRYSSRPAKTAIALLGQKSWTPASVIMSANK
jgi:hypothetical protein